MTTTQPVLDATAARLRRRALVDKWATPVVLGAAALFLLVNVGFKQFLEYLLLGLPQGGIIALIAIGYSMVYGIILLINFAHGEIFMLSAYLTLMLLLPIGPSEEDVELQKMALKFAVFLGATTAVSIWTLLSGVVNRLAPRLAASIAGGAAMGFAMFHLQHMALPFWLALAVSALISPTFGIAMDTLAYRPLRNAPRLVPLITAIGMSSLLVNAGQIMFGPGRRSIPDERLPDILRPGEMIPPGTGWWESLVHYKKVVVTETLTFPAINAVIVLLALVVMFATSLFVKRTRAGKAMRACAQDHATARLMGINVDATVALTFAIGSALAALAAPFWVLKYASIEPGMGTVVGVLAFASAVLGGIGNLKGAMVGGMLMGIIYNFVPVLEGIDRWSMIVALKNTGWFPGVKDWNLLAGISEWRLGIAYLFLIGVIVLKPTGILGTTAASRRS